VLQLLVKATAGTRSLEGANDGRVYAAPSLNSRPSPSGRRNSRAPLPRPKSELGMKGFALQTSRTDCACLEVGYSSCPWLGREARAVELGGLSGPSWAFSGLRCSLARLNPERAF
jgi:hypothetical protein